MESNIKLIATKHRNVVNVQLNLDGQKRHLGQIDFAYNGTLITERKENHRLRAGNAFGINYSLLVDESISFKNIVVIYEGRKLITTRLFFLTHGQYLKFKNFDAQVFLNINLFGSPQAEAFEAETKKLEAAAQNFDLFGQVA